MFSLLLPKIEHCTLHGLLGWLLNLNGSPKIRNSCNSVKKYFVDMYQVKLKNTEPYHFYSLKMHTFFLPCRR